MFDVSSSPHVGCALYIYCKHKRVHGLDWKSTMVEIVEQGI